MPARPPARRGARALAAVALSATTLLGGFLVAVPAHAAAPQEVSAAQQVCQYRVTVNGLYVRSGPGTQYTAVAWLSSGTLVYGTSTVQNGFRKLSGANRWASSQYLARTNTPCAA
ncbi:SH3 domain-containing protein [Nocardiopsis ganjiahuensis]|uniref:hypothetical protein n=1 Tax=Nocardiopsis ganjiahuensis TaxID=239984 RepID=UPI000345FC14|nr:hypothetical protein [Nocardiopsis ganjiahuensis]